MMEPTKMVWGFVVGIPSVLLGLLVVLFPSLLVPLVVLLVLIWVGAVALWLRLKFKEFDLENKRLVGLVVTKDKQLHDQAEVHIRELRELAEAYQAKRPSMKWGDLKVNPIFLKGFGLGASSVTRYVTTVKVINDGPVPLTDVTAWADVEGSPILLPWTVPNADGSRQTKSLNPNDEDTFEICAWDAPGGERVMPTESGWGHPRTFMLDRKTMVKVRVTCREGAKLGPRDATILRTEDLEGVNEAPLLAWE